MNGSPNCSACLFGYSFEGSPQTCQIICGDGMKASSEQCDDGNLKSDDGCSSSCTIESGYSCTGDDPSVCS